MNDAATYFTSKRASFAEVVAVTGVEAKALRNYLEPGRAVLQQPARGGDGRYSFDMNEIAVILIMSDLTRSIGLKPQAAAEAAKAVAPFFLNELQSFFAPEEWRPPDILLAFAGTGVEAFARATDPGASWEYKDLRTGREWTPSEHEDSPPLTWQAHVRLPTLELGIRLAEAFRAVEKDARS